MQPIYTSITEAVRILGVSKSSIYRLIDERHLKSIKREGRRLVVVDSIHRIGKGEGA